jgi:hypothetical protein
LVQWVRRFPESHRKVTAVTTDDFRVTLVRAEFAGTINGLAAISH